MLLDVNESSMRSFGHLMTKKKSTILGTVHSKSPFYSHAVISTTGSLAHVYVAFWSLALRIHTMLLDKSADWVSRIFPLLKPIA